MLVLDRSMTFEHQKRLWHKHFIPSLLAGLVVAVIALFLDMTAANAVLFASIGASAMILTHSESHHLTKLRSSVIAYFVMIIIAVLLRGLNTLIPLADTVNIFLSVSLVGIAIILADAFHPPAISASLSFALFSQPLLSLFWLFLTVIALLILVRLATYVIHKNLSFKDFLQEFKETF